MIISVAKPEELKEGDIVIIDYGLTSKQKVYLSYVERPIDGGKAIVVGTGGHAHRVPFEDILAHVVGQADEAYFKVGANIVMRDHLDTVMAKGGGGLLTETFRDYYDRTYTKGG